MPCLRMSASWPVPLKAQHCATEPSAWKARSLLGPHDHPEVSMHTLPLRQYVERLERQDLPGVADLMLRSAHRLAAAGAELSDLS